MKSPSHIFFIGYRGCGKSAVGRIVAEKLELPFVDTDITIESNAGRSIAEIFAESGEATFRDLESSAISSSKDLAPSVISLGGGAILREANRDWIKKLGKAIWLKASPEVLATRIAQDTTTSARRPALSKLGTLDEIVSILSIRTPLYHAAADIEIDTTDLSPLDVASKVIECLKPLP